MDSQREIEALRSAAEAELKKLPNVLGVGYGPKNVGGRQTDWLALRVFVREKRPPGELGPDDVAPPAFGGLPTDVVEVIRSENFADCEDLDRGSTVVGGITIALLQTNSLDVGTAGFLATSNDLSGNENVVMVTNAHVFADSHSHLNDVVYYPRLRIDGDAYRFAINVANNQEDKNPVGKIHHLGFYEHLNYKDVGDANAIDYWVDCATAKLDMQVTSWCNKNFGVPFKGEINKLNTVNLTKTTNTVEGVARVQLHETVYKVGRQTGPTKGIVRRIDASVQKLGDPLIKQNCIEIEPAADHTCNGKFALPGDSGSAVVNERNELVGLLFGGDAATGFGHASHINPVLTRMNIKAITRLAPHPSASSRSDAPGVIVGEGVVRTTTALRETLSRSERGREVAVLFDAHREEIFHLVNRRRPVTVVWHRGKGPAFLAHAADSARHPERLVPREIDGVSRRTLVENMARAFSEHGSPALREAVRLHLDETLYYAERFDNLHGLVERLGGGEGL
jgi:hypothetical protein